MHVQDFTHLDHVKAGIYDPSSSHTELDTSVTNPLRILVQVFIVKLGISFLIDLFFFKCIQAMAGNVITPTKINFSQVSIFFF